jgi:Flp pilus assembly protein TadD
MKWRYSGVSRHQKSNSYCVLRGFAGCGRELMAVSRYLGHLPAAIRLDLNDADAWFNKGNALKSLGRTKEADAAVSEAKDLEYKG